MRKMHWQMATTRLGLFMAAALMVPVTHAQLVSTLYLTGEGATGRLRGDTTALPASAARCANCHEPSRQTGGADATFGPRLDARLAQALPRRGGPPSAYGPEALCTLLRSGLDPARILVRRAMPVYEIDDKACTTLWQVLSLREPLPQPTP